MPRLLRILVLVCGLTLVLPPGWCCFAWCATAKPAAPKACCGCNKCHHRQAPAPKSPSVPPEKDCPCVGRVATPAPAPKPVLTATAPVVGMSLAGLDQAAVVSGESIAIPVEAARPSLNLVHCCWRC